MLEIRYPAMPHPPSPRCLCGYSLSGLPGPVVTCPECGVVTDIRLIVPKAPAIKSLDFLPLAPWPVLWVLDTFGGLGLSPEASGANLPLAIGVTVVLSGIVLVGAYLHPRTAHSGRMAHLALWWVAGNVVFVAAGLFWALLKRSAGC